AGRRRAIHALEGAAARDAGAASRAARVSGYAVHRCPARGPRASDRDGARRAPGGPARLGCGEPAEAARRLADAQGARGRAPRAAALAARRGLALALPGP